MTLMHHQNGSVNRALVSRRCAPVALFDFDGGCGALHLPEIAGIGADLGSVSCCCCSCHHVSGAFMGYAQLLTCCGCSMLMTRGVPKPFSRDTAGDCATQVERIPHQ